MQSGATRSGLAVVGLSAIVGGVVIWHLPWERWGRSSSLVLVPTSLVLIIAHNVTAGTDGFRYGLFFMVAWVWVGLGHPRGTATWFAPLLIAAYAGPLLLVGERSSVSLASTVYAVPSCIIVGEAVAWVAERLRRSDEALRRSGERFQSLVQHAADVVFLVDAAGAIRYDSPAIERVLGYSTVERIGHFGGEYVHRDDLPRLAVAFAELLRTPGATTSMEARIRHADGRWRWCEAVVCNLLHEPSVASVVVNLADITESRAAEEALRDRERSFRVLFESNLHPMWVFDVETLAFLEVNDAAVRHYGYCRAEFLTMAITDIRPREDVDPVVDRIRKRTPDAEARARRHRLKDGRVIDVEITSGPLEFAGRSAVLVAVTDMTERKKLESQLRHQAYHDGLTGLANRARFLDRVEHALALRRQDGGSLAVLLLDIDGFKTVNDSLGHDAGDALLCGVASRLVGALLSGDTAARLGGDEFVVLVESVGGIRGRDPEATVRRILADLARPFTVCGREIFAGASVGIVVGGGGDRADELLRSADAAMYRAKAEQPGSYRVFQPSMHEAAVARLELHGRLRRAVEADEFIIHYQPIVSLTDGAMIGVEALVRWDDPVAGLVSPADFIGAAEETGLIVSIGDSVLRQACAQIAEWRAERPGLELSVSVNLSGRQLADAGLVATVRDILRESGVPAELLCLEITETVLMRESDSNLARLHDLKALGVRLAIDDFGTGYSSLSYLRQFPVDVLKIDKSFMDGVARDVEGRSFVKAIVRLAQTLRIATVAEGVEDEAQLETLRRVGCDRAQGFLFARPQPAAELGAILRSGWPLATGELQAS